MRPIVLGAMLLVASPCFAQDTRPPAIAYCKMEYLKNKGNVGYHEADFMKFCMQSKGFEFNDSFGCYGPHDTIACYRQPAAPAEPPTALDKAKRWLSDFLK